MRVIYTILFCILCAPYVVGNAHARRLYDDLFVRNDYNPEVRPVYNDTNIMDVELGLKLSQLVDVVRNYYVK